MESQVLVFEMLIFVCLLDILLDAKHTNEYTSPECKKQFTKSPSQFEYPSLPGDLVRILCKVFKNYSPHTSGSFSKKLYYSPNKHFFM